MKDDVERELKLMQEFIEDWERNRPPEDTGNLIAEVQADRPKNPAPDLLPTTIFPPYDKLPMQFQTLHLWALKKVLPLVATCGRNLQFDLSRLYRMRIAMPHPLGNMPLVVLTASTFDVVDAPDMTPEQSRQDHLRLQNDLAHLSTNSKQIMVSGSGHLIYLNQPQVVIRSIAAVVKSAKKHSRLPPIE